MLNLTTGTISPQFHVVIDDWFTSVSSDAKETDEPLDDKVWTELLMDHRVDIYFDENSQLELDEEWLTESERVDRHERAAARVRARNYGQDESQRVIVPPVNHQSQLPAVQPNV